MRSTIIAVLILSAASIQAQTTITGQVSADRPRIFLTPQTLDTWRQRFLLPPMHQA